MKPVVIGNATLYCADCMDVLPTLGKVDAVVTDPPYGIGFARVPTKWAREKGQQPSYWDDEKSDLSAVLNIQANKIIWGGDRFGLPAMRRWLIWVKPDAPPSFSSVEMAWTDQDAPARHLVHSISATNKERVGHPTQKPLRVMTWCMGFVPDAQTILDPFMGSGTTGVACMNLGKQFIGIEREPKYFDIACERIEMAQAQGKLFA